MIMPSAIRNVILRNGSFGCSHPIEMKYDIIAQPARPPTMAARPMRAPTIMPAPHRTVDRAAPRSTYQAATERGRRQVDRTQRRDLRASDAAGDAERHAAEEPRHRLPQQVGIGQRAQDVRDGEP